MKIVVDTNIILSALIRDSTTKHLLVSLNANFYYPEVSFDEILRNKQEVLVKAKITEEKFNQALAILFKYITIIKDEELSLHLREADKIIGSIHRNDVPFIAAALAKNATVWSNDGHFQKQNRIPVLTTQDIISRI